MNAALAPSSFQMVPAVRKANGLLMSVVGASSSGKTFSLLRLATGIQRVVGGELAVIDTENGRALHYADKFSFGHIDFPAPYSPARYLEALRYAIDEGARTIIVDSMSHEHAGVGGVLDAHEEWLDKLSGGEAYKRDAMNFTAWKNAKEPRIRLIDELVRMNVNILFGFRAKEKIRIEKVKGKKAEIFARGWQPVAGEEYIFEMGLQCLLKPGSKGAPTWASDIEDEEAMMKLPEQFRRFFTEPRPLDEDLGMRLAEWTTGIDMLVPEYERCTTSAAFDKLETRRQAIWPKISGAYKAKLKPLADAAKARIAGQPKTVQATAVSSESVSSPDGKSLTWEQRIRAASDTPSLNKLRDECRAAHNGDLPLELDAACSETREDINSRDEVTA